MIYERGEKQRRTNEMLARLEEFKSARDESEIDALMAKYQRERLAEIQAMPAEERSGRDQVELAVHLVASGRLAEAETLLESLDPDKYPIFWEEETRVARALIQLCRGAPDEAKSELLKVCRSLSGYTDVVRAPRGREPMYGER